jgi:hypothetical protein
MKVTDRNYELAGAESMRVIVNFFRWKIMPFGNISDGPGVVWLFSIWFRHKFGRMIASYKIRKASRAGKH